MLESVAKNLSNWEFKKSVVRLSYLGVTTIDAKSQSSNSLLDMILSLPPSIHTPNDTLLNLFLLTKAPPVSFWSMTPDFNVLILSDEIFDIELYRTFVPLLVLVPNEEIAPPQVLIKALSI